MQIIKYLIIGIPFAAMFVVLATLALGPAYLAARNWFRKRGHL